MLRINLVWSRKKERPGNVLVFDHVVKSGTGETKLVLEEIYCVFPSWNH